MYGVTAPTLHHYPHSLSGNYHPLSAQGLQRTSTLASMYGTGSLGYGTSDWGSLAAAAHHHSTAGMASSNHGLLSRDHREYLPCAAAAAAVATSNTGGLPLSTHSNYVSAMSLPYPVPNLYTACKTETSPIHISTNPSDSQKENSVDIHHAHSPKSTGKFIQANIFISELYQHNTLFLILLV